MKIISTLIENDPMGSNLVASSLVYATLNEKERRIFIEKGFIASFEIGEFLIREDEIGDRFFILRSGNVEVFTFQNGKKVPLSIMSMGACIGEGSLVTKCRRTANVQCLTEVVALVFNFSDIENIIEKNENVKRLLRSLIEKRAEMTAEKLLNNID